MISTIYNHITEGTQSGKKRFVVLIDPDKTNLRNISQTIDMIKSADVNYLFIGGSLLMYDMLDESLSYIQKHTDIPTILFPGNSAQINERADAMLLLSLISGRNPDLLIGQHVTAAPYLKQSQLEVISTGYMLIDGGVSTSVSYMSNTQPIPANKRDIAACTAIAGQYLGCKMIYMDAGSGAINSISNDMITCVKQQIDIPLIIGGGIQTPEMAYECARAGADIVVVGNAIEKDPSLLQEMADAVHVAEHCSDQSSVDIKSSVGS